jgi:hypothetical protein
MDEGSRIYRPRCNLPTAVGEEQQVKESMHKSLGMSARGDWRLGEPQISPDPPRSVHP